jgi:hypothetical protein
MPETGFTIAQRSLKIYEAGNSIPPWGPDVRLSE